MDKIHVTVAAIIKRNDHYLLVKERASSGDIVFNQPAGHVELNESLPDAIIREVKEETGLDFTPTGIVGTYLLSPAANGKTYLRFCFVGEVPEGQSPSPQDPEILENCWFSLEDGKRIPLETVSFYNDEHRLGENCCESLTLA